MAHDMSTQDFYLVSLKAILKNREGKVLGLKSVASSNFAGFYDLPGGRIHEDEFDTPYLEILAREVKEEIGNADFKIHPKPVAIGRHRFTKDYDRELGREFHIIYIFFEANYLGGEIKISDEHSGYAWIDLQAVDLKKYFTSGILEGMQMYVSNSRE